HPRAGDGAGETAPLTAPAGAKLQRPAELGSAAEVRLVIHFAASQDEGSLTVRLLHPDRAVAAALVLSGGRLRLLNLTGPPRRETVLAKEGTPAAALRTWELRLEARYGLGRVKAWPQGTPEPRDWASANYNGSVVERPRRLQIEAEQGPVTVVALTVRGTAPLWPSPAQLEQEQRAAR